MEGERGRIERRRDRIGQKKIATMQRRKVSGNPWRKKDSTDVFERRGSYEALERTIAT